MNRVPSAEWPRRFIALVALAATLTPGATPSAHACDLGASSGRARAADATPAATRAATRELVGPVVRLPPVYVVASRKAELARLEREARDPDRHARGRSARPAG